MTAFFRNKCPENFDNVRTIEHLYHFKFTGFIFLILLYFFQGYFMSTTLQLSTIDFTKGARTNLLLDLYI